MGRQVARKSRRKIDTRAEPARAGPPRNRGKKSDNIPMIKDFGQTAHVRTILCTLKKNMFINPANGKIVVPQDTLSDIYHLLGHLRVNEVDTGHVVGVQSK